MAAGERSLRRRHATREAALPRWMERKLPQPDDSGTRHPGDTKHGCDGARSAHPTWDGARTWPPQIPGSSEPQGESKMMQTIGFIGLGHMGAGMAGRLLQAGYDVTVYNRTPGKAQELIDRGAHRADRAADACRGDAVITMLADDGAVEGVVLGED